VCSSPKKKIGPVTEDGDLTRDRVIAHSPQLAAQARFAAHPSGPADEARPRRVPPLRPRWLVSRLACIAWPNSSSGRAMITDAAVVSTTSRTPNWHAMRTTDPRVTQARTLLASCSLRHGQSGSRGTRPRWSRVCQCHARGPQVVLRMSDGGGRNGDPSIVYEMGSRLTQLESDRRPTTEKYATAFAMLLDRKVKGDTFFQN
jgi:hypothetical protein